MANPSFEATCAKKKSRRPLTSTVSNVRYSKRTTSALGRLLPFKPVFTQCPGRMNIGIGLTTKKSD